MRIVVKKVGEDFGEIREIENEIEPLQEIVGGWVQTVSMGHDILLCLNDEGKLKNLPINFFLGFDFIVGDVAFVGVDRDEMVSLSDKQLDFLRKQNFLK